MDEELTAEEVLERQQQLESAARKKFPWDPSECTLYMDTADRQLLFACLTCKPNNAICYACGIRCHTNHHIVELDSKRHFRCDCGTSRLPESKCRLRPTKEDEWPNSHLTYNQNFRGKFCGCSESTEDESYGEGAMFQCLVGTRCGEDWFHARCITGVSREEEAQRQEAANNEMADEVADKVADEVTNEVEAGVKTETNADTADEAGNEAANESDAASMASDDSGDELTAVFPELPGEFGGLICPECAKDVLPVVESSAVLKQVKGYVFLREDYADILSGLPELAPLIRQYPFLASDEGCYRPDRDEDGTSLLEAGEKALSTLPHEAVMSGLARFNEMQGELVEFLKSISKEGRSISRTDIEHFFDSI